MNDVNKVRTYGHKSREGTANLSGKIKYAAMR